MIQRKLEIQIKPLSMYNVKLRLTFVLRVNTFRFTLHSTIPFDQYCAKQVIPPLDQKKYILIQSECKHES